MPKQNSDHVVVNCKEGGAFECRHCNTKQLPPWPINVTDLLPIINKFVSEHIDCVDQRRTAVFSFVGGSDDIVTVGMSTIENKILKSVRGEYDCCQNTDDIIMAEFHLGKRMKVYAIYDGCWMFAVGRVDEGTPLPGWPVNILGSEGYSVQMDITAPAWAELERVDATA